MIKTSGELQERNIDKILKDRNEWKQDWVEYCDMRDKGHSFLEGFYLTKGDRQIEYNITSKPKKDYGMFIVNDYKNNGYGEYFKCKELYKGGDYEKAMEVFNREFEGSCIMKYWDKEMVDKYKKIGIDITRR